MSDTDVLRWCVGWRVVAVREDGNMFRAIASYYDPASTPVRGTVPDYKLSDRGRTPQEAIDVLLTGCRLDKRWPHVVEGLMP